MGGLGDALMLLVFIASSLNERNNQSALGFAPFFLLSYFT